MFSEANLLSLSGPCRAFVSSSSPPVSSREVRSRDLDFTFSFLSARAMNNLISSVGLVFCLWGGGGGGVGWIFVTCM